MILGCEGLADYHCGLHSLEVPLSSGTRLQHSTCSFAAHVGCGRWKAEDWGESGALSSEVTEIISDNVVVNSLENKRGVVAVDNTGSCLDTEGIALYIDLPCSPCKDSAEYLYIKSYEQLLSVESKGDVPVPALAAGSHEQLKMTGRAEVSQRSEIKISSNLGSHVVRAFLGSSETGPRFKRWRQVTAIDQNSETASYTLKNSEILPGSKMSALPVKEGLVESVPSRDVKAGLPESDIKASGDQHRNCSQGESPILIVGKTEAKTPLNLGTHALRALMDADDVQKLKRRRLTTPADSTPVRDSKEGADKISPDSLSRQLSEVMSKDNESPEDSLLSPGSDGLPVAKSSSRSDSASASAQNATDVAGSGDCTSEITSSGVLKGKSDSQSDSSSGSPANSPLDKYISRPLKYSGGSESTPKKKEWLGHHHGCKGDPSIAKDVSFAGNVGACFRLAIDGRPAASHPGFVGDGASVQFCKICGEKEDATSSLICDSCEGVFHMACLNSRMKIVPRVDEWLCRSCKKKRKMSRENENQGDSDQGEPKDWWREDSGIGRVERELLRMSNGRRMKVRIGPKYQADVPEWTGIVEEVDLDDNLAESSPRFGYEAPLTLEEKQLEKETAENNLKNNLWPRGWLPATQLPPGSKENWLQCQIVLFDEGEICPDGRRAETEVICGKWRRAPLGVVPDDQWECSCALVWDPRHADCAVLQELSTEEITERMKATKLISQQGPNIDENVSDSFQHLQPRLLGWVQLSII